MKFNRNQILKGGAVLVLVAGLIVALRLLPVAEYLPRFLETVHSLGWLGPILLAAVYIVATVLFVPGTILTLAAGFLYGPLLGTAIVSPASVIGATLAFLLGRTVARGWISRKIAGNPKFASLDEAIDREGLKILVLVRLSPIFPFNVVNYAFGLTRLRLRDFVLGSFVAMLPGTFLYVYIGSLVPDMATLAAGSAAPGGMTRQIFLWVGLAATILVTALITRTARKALREAAPRIETVEGAAHV